MGARCTPRQVAVMTLPAIALLEEINPRDPRAQRSIQIHDARVLQGNHDFKGAVLATHGTGAVLWHNSGFSNWYPFTDNGEKKLFGLEDMGTTYEFGSSEALIMAVKEHVGTGKPLELPLTKHSRLGAGESKKQVSGNAFPLWDNHPFQVLLGAVACLLKFSQVGELRKELLGTGAYTMIESAPNDGAWGIAANTWQFISRREDPESYGLQSTNTSTITFSTRAGTYTRMKRQSNALGKALMLVRSVLRSNQRQFITLGEAFVAVKGELGKMHHNLDAEPLGMLEQVGDQATLAGTVKELERLCMR